MYVDMYNQMCINTCVFDDVCNLCKISKSRSCERSVMLRSYECASSLVTLSSSPVAIHQAAQAKSDNCWDWETHSVEAKLVNCLTDLIYPAYVNLSRPVMFSFWTK